MAVRTTCYLCPEETDLEVHGGDCLQGAADYCPICDMHVSVAEA